MTQALPQLAQLSLLLVFLIAGLVAALTLRKHRTVSMVALALAALSAVAHLGIEALVALLMIYPELFSTIGRWPLRVVWLSWDIGASAMVLILAGLAAWEGPA